jgi:acylphosphatase
MTLEQEAPMKPAMEATAQRLTAIVHGRVQGVGFREATRRQAQRLGLVGYVRNLPNPRQVEVVAEGPAAALKQFERWLHQGPVLARVEEVDVHWSAAHGEFDQFQIRF